MDKLYIFHNKKIYTKTLNPFSLDVTQKQSHTAARYTDVSHYREILSLLMLLFSQMRAGPLDTRA
jgi:hypothetical protein